jgi:hypothetical protein
MARDSVEGLAALGKALEEGSGDFLRQLVKRRRMSGRKAIRKKGNQLGSKANVKSNEDEDIEYINIGTFTSDETDKILNSYKKNNIRCNVMVRDELKKVLRSYGGFQAQFDICVHPECLNRALDLRDGIILWAKRLRDAKK